MKRCVLKRAGFKPKRVYVRTPHSPLAAVVRNANAGPSEREAVAVPKRVYVRSKALREAYRFLPCQYAHDSGIGICGSTLGVCCNHSNWSIHGKGTRIKASDDRGASGCSVHHFLLDQGHEWDEGTKQFMFWGAHVRSVKKLVRRGWWPSDVPVPDLTFPAEWL
jgi:hypothetical protein